MQPYVVVMAGGSGTRFWPASRRARPKQYLPIARGKVMLRETLDRLAGWVPWERVLVVSAHSQRELVRACLPELPEANLLAEPAARNTAPAVAWAAFEIARRDPSAGMVVLAADHVIEPAASFRRSLEAGLAEADASGALITFGIRPTHAATGYGYIEVGARVGERDAIAVHAVARFVEKPERARAEEFVASGRFLWNAGIFAWRADAILAAFRAHLPQVLAGLERAYSGGALAEIWPALPSLPVDTAILERANNVRTLPIDYRWSDVGSWSALPEVSAPDAQGNFAFLSGGARLVAHDATGCVVYGEGEGVLALVGVKDLVVVRAGNALLVCPRERAQDVKKIVEALERDGAREFL
ncbi:MAG: mannose-1-phosphate guanyltransferase [Planctomycetota bacterium]|nr:MAG: mannose-1-phosphate guanyltransferase [Planctomycetota bacterium]